MLHEVATKTHGKRRPSIVHFGTDRAALCSRTRSLNRMGYKVLNASNGFEAIRWAVVEDVDAVVLDMDRDQAEIALVAKEIKRCRPDVPTIVLVDGTSHHLIQLADVLVPKRNHPGMLSEAVKTALAASGGSPRMAESHSNAV